MWHQMSLNPKCDPLSMRHEGFSTRTKAAVTASKARKPS